MCVAVEGVCAYVFVCVEPSPAAAAVGLLSRGCSPTAERTDVVKAASTPHPVQTFWIKARSSFYFIILVFFTVYNEMLLEICFICIYCQYVISTNNVVTTLFWGLLYWFIFLIFCNTHVAYVNIKIKSPMSQQNIRNTIQYNARYVLTITHYDHQHQ